MSRYIYTEILTDRKKKSRGSNHTGWNTSKDGFRGLPTPTSVIVLLIFNTSKLTTCHTIQLHLSDPFLNPPPHASKNITSHLHEPGQLFPRSPLSLLSWREPITAVWFQDSRLTCLALRFLKLEFDDIIEVLLSKCCVASLLYSICTKTYTTYTHT